MPPCSRLLRVKRQCKLWVRERLDVKIVTDMVLLVLVSGWSDNGWLSGGHAVRMAMELCE